jgi:hypothetical protein
VSHIPQAESSYRSLDLRAGRTKRGLRISGWLIRRCGNTCKIARQIGPPCPVEYHEIPIAEIGDTHRAVCGWSEANGYRLIHCRWEIYGDPDPSTGDFNVKVIWSLLARS